MWPDFGNGVKNGEWPTVNSGIYQLLAITLSCLASNILQSVCEGSEFLVGMGQRRGSDMPQEGNDDKEQRNSLG